MFVFIHSIVYVSYILKTLINLLNGAAFLFHPVIKAYKAFTFPFVSCCKKIKKNA